MHLGGRRSALLEVLEELSGSAAGRNDALLLIEHDDDLPTFLDQEPTPLGLELEIDAGLALALPTEQSFH